MYLELQNRNMTLPAAHKLIERQIRILESMVESKDQFRKETEQAVPTIKFQGVTLHEGKKVKEIHPNHF